MISGISLSDKEVELAIREERITERFVHFLNDFSITLLEIETAELDLSNHDYRGARICYENALGHLSEISQRGLPEHYGKYFLPTLQERINSIRGSLPSSYSPQGKKTPTFIQPATNTLTPITVPPANPVWNMLGGQR